MDSVASRAEEGTGIEGIKGAFSVDAGKGGAHLDELVRGTVEQTLNALLDAEAEQACKAGAVRAISRPAGHAGREL